MRIEEVRSGLVARLRKRRGEIEQAATARARTVSDPRETADPEYMEGLGRATAAAVGYGLAALEMGEDQSPPIPEALLLQARLAARNRVGLDTVLRRYFAGYALLGDFVIEEWQRSGLSDGPSLKRLLRAQAVLFDRVIAAVSEEHTRETERRSLGSERRLAERVERLLDGELVDASELAYDFNGFHLAAVVMGADVQDLIRELARGLDRLLLLALPHDDVAWAWWGGRRPFEADQIEAILGAQWPAGACLALGEPGQGIPGWRLSHQQARAAMALALRCPGAPARYADAPLLAAALQDGLLATSLRDLYLAPLAKERDGGKAAREALRAYFAAGRNVSSAAAALSITRKTAASRLLAIEVRLGCTLDSCGAELEVALGLDDSA